MKAYGKSWGYNVYDCQYCLYWKGKLKGCVCPDGCCCPYGRAAPCIGWCTKEVMRAAGLPKERDRSHV